jgi:hypothetical protein
VGAEHRRGRDPAQVARAHHADRYLVDVAHVPGRLEIATDEQADPRQVGRLQLRAAEHRRREHPALLVHRQRVVHRGHAELADRQRAGRGDRLERAGHLGPQRVDVRGLERLTGDLAAVDLLEDGMGGGVYAALHRDARGLLAPEAGTHAEPECVALLAGPLQVDRDRVVLADVGDHALCPGPEAHPG